LIPLSVRSSVRFLLLLHPQKENTFQKRESCCLAQRIKARRGAVLPQVNKKEGKGEKKEVLQDG